MKRQTPPSIHVGLPGDLRDRLNAAAKKRDIPSSLLIRIVLAHYLSKDTRIAAAVDGKLFE